MGTTEPTPRLAQPLRALAALHHTMSLLPAKELHLCVSRLVNHSVGTMPPSLHRTFMLTVALSLLVAIAAAIWPPPHHCAMRARSAAPSDVVLPAPQPDRSIV